VQSLFIRPQFFYAKVAILVSFVSWQYFMLTGGSFNHNCLLYGLLLGVGPLEW